MTGRAPFPTLGLALPATPAAAQQVPLMGAARNVVATYRGVGSGDVQAVAPCLAWLGRRRRISMTADA